MPWNSPIPRSGTPRFHEASTQQSPRSSDATARIWQKNRDAAENIHRVANAVEQLQKDMNRLRRRRMGAEEQAQVGGTIKKFELRSIEMDHLVCRELTIDSSGVRTAGDTDILIAKYAEVRGSVAAEVLDGVSVAYSSYTATTYISRTATPSGGSGETQVIVPRYRTGSSDPRSIIFAAQVENGTGVWVDDVEVTWQELSPRYWAYANVV